MAARKERGASRSRTAPVSRPPSLEGRRQALLKHLLLLGAFLEREGSRLVSPHGLNQQQFVLLKEIEERGPIAQRDLCSALLFEKSNVSKIVAKLRGRGLVGVTRPEGDYRQTMVSLSPRGGSVIRKAMSELVRWNSSWLEVLDDSEVSAGLAVLQKLSRRQA